MNSSILFCESLKLPEALKHSFPKVKKIFLLCDSNTLSLYGFQFSNALEKAAYQVSSLSLDPGEKSKNLQNIEKIWRHLYLSGCDKNTLFINLGGGVVSDIGGFAASSYYRGLPLVNIPTTLMAMVDAAIGGKNGINTSTIKNAIGTVYHPAAIFIVPDFLKSLPNKEISCGMAEVIKYAYIKKSALLPWIQEKAPFILSRNPNTLKELIKASISCKNYFVYQKPQQRDLLNFGHSIGHAIESLGSYHRLSHGEAISIGMSASLFLSQSLHKLPSQPIENLHKTLDLFNLPHSLKEEYPIEDLIERMKRDKKSENEQISDVLLKEMGNAYLHPHVPVELVKVALLSIQPKKRLLKT